MKLIFVGAILAVLPGMALPQSTTPPEFEVAAVKPSQCGGQAGGGFLPGGRVELRALTMKELIAIAWDFDGDRVSGGPAWLDSDCFEIVAKAPPDSPRDAMRPMLQTLLTKRFNMTVHNEDKVVQVYALTVAKTNPNLTESGAPGDAECKMRNINGVRTYVCKNMTMEGLAKRLPGVATAYLDHPVVDLTGLKGVYDFTLAWTGRGRIKNGGSPVADASQAASAPAAAEPVEEHTIFEAVNQQLGLKLAPQKHSLPAVVIDHVDRTAAEN